MASAATAPFITAPGVTHHSAPFRTIFSQKWLRATGPSHSARQARPASITRYAEFSRRN